MAKLICSITMRAIAKTHATLDEEEDRGRPTGRQTAVGKPMTTSWLLTNNEDAAWLTDESWEVLE